MLKKDGLLYKLHILIDEIQFFNKKMLLVESIIV
jgi:hypothetical protein